MTISTGWKLDGLAAIGVGIAATLTACSGGAKKPAPANGDMSDLTTDLMSRLKPGATKLNVSTDAIRRFSNGALDGTRLVQAADTHAYGTPTIIDPAKDVRGDGFASFNEVRHVARHFDTDATGTWNQDETRAFEAAVGIRWIPA
jgi:hypothetical protein